MIRIDEIWLAIEPLDIRAGPDTALARVVKVFGTARPHCAYRLANLRGSRVKVLIYDGLGVWLCTRRFLQGKFQWAGSWHRDRVELLSEQVTALVQSLCLIAHRSGGGSQAMLCHTERVNQKLTYELALLKCHAFGKRSEQLNVLQSACWMGWWMPISLHRDGAGSTCRPCGAACHGANA